MLLVSVILTVFISNLFWFCNGLVENLDNYKVSFYAKDVAHVNPSNISSTKIPDPDFTAISSDAFLAVWAQLDNKKASSEVWGRIFVIIDNDDDETKDGLLDQSGRFRINNFTTNAQDTAVATALYDIDNRMLNRFVVCWESSWQDSDYDGIFCNMFEHTERYDSDTKKMTTNVFAYKRDNNNPSPGSEWQVNQHNASYQKNAQVTPLYNTGEYVVSWLSFNQDSSNKLYDVYARVYNNDGTPRTNEFSVHEHSEKSEQYVKLSPFLVNMGPDCDNYWDCINAADDSYHNNKCFKNHKSNSSYFLVTWTATEIVTNEIVFVNIISNDGISCLDFEDQLIGFGTTLNRDGVQDNNNRWERSDVTHLWENYFLVAWTADNDTEYYNDQIQCGIYKYDISTNSLDLLELIKMNHLDLGSIDGATASYPRVSLIDIQGCSLCQTGDYNGDDDTSGSSSSSDDSSSNDNNNNNDDDSSSEISKTALIQTCWQSEILSVGVSSKDVLLRDIYCQWLYLELDESSISNPKITHKFLYDDGEDDYLISEETPTSGNKYAHYPILTSFWRAIISNGDRLSIRSTLNQLTISQYLPDYYSIVGWQTTRNINNGGGNYNVYARIIGINYKNNNKNNHEYHRATSTAAVVFSCLAAVIIIVCVVLGARYFYQKKQTNGDIINQNSIRTNGNNNKNKNKNKNRPKMAGFDGNRKGYTKTSTQAGTLGTNGNTIGDESGSDIELGDDDDEDNNNNNNMNRSNGMNGSGTSRKKRRRTRRKNDNEYGNGIGNDDDDDEDDMNDRDERINVDVVDE